MISLFNRFNKNKGQPASNAELLKHWQEHPLQCFIGQRDQPLQWHTCYGLEALGGAPGTHGYSTFPDLWITAKLGTSELDIGWIDNIRMHSGGTVIVKHFALEQSLTHQGYGTILLNSIITLLKSHHATSIEFQETHSRKIDHYRRFFIKNIIEESRPGVWSISLYPDGQTPTEVRSFHHSLQRSVDR